MNTRQGTQPVEELRPNLDYATITERPDSRHYRVRLSFGEIEAKKAASCLLAPDVNDQVLVSVDLSGACFILSVLERHNPEMVNELTFSGDTVLQTSGGSLDLRAEHDLRLSAAQTMDISAAVMRAAAGKGELLLGSLSFLGKKIRIQADRITTVAKNVEQSLKRLTQRMDNCERFVRDHEEVQTGSTRYLVEDSLTTHAGNTTNISEELHVMHAEQIHMS